MTALRLGAACLLLALAGCDTTGPDVEPYDDGLVVSVTEADDGTPTLALTTETIPGCRVPLVVESRTTRDAVEVEFLGLDPVTGTTCLALIRTTWTQTLPPLGDGLDVRIRHRGEVDRYRVTDGPTLTPVRTSVTRPAE
ncbi:MAG: hypothetical protein AAF845_06775 [Bacteroidota bacterium]